MMIVLDHRDRDGHLLPARGSTDRRRYLDDKAWLENRRIMEILREIEVKALAVGDAPPRDAFMGHLRRLTPPEQALYDDLRLNRLGRRVRLEQERISFGPLERALDTIRRGCPGISA
jgi:hypothetical protein